MPEPLAHKFLSRRSTPVEELYRERLSCTYRYLEGMVAAGFDKTDGQTKRKSWVALEAGTGLYNPLAAPLMLAGITKFILLEPFVNADFNVERFQSRFRTFIELAEADPAFPLNRIVRGNQIFPATLTEESAGKPTVSVTTRFWEDTGLSDASIDLLLSASVLEHLRNPKAVISESARILKPGGFTINVVDMRDHFFRYPLEMLNYPEWAWELLTTRAGGSGYQNRWRLSQWIKEFDTAGFHTVCIPNLTIPAAQLERLRPNFHKDYAQLPVEDLQVLHATLISRRL